MDTVQVYVVAGPNNIHFGGRNVPGGFEYLSRNLFLLASLNQDVNFEVLVAHSIFHGPSSDFQQYPNMQIYLHLFGEDHIVGLKDLDPVLQHGTLLNALLKKISPNSRFVLILDPDCYAIEKNLISSCIQKLNDSEISVMGIPYPTWYPKEYSLETPQLYFSLFDRTKIKIEELDLRAGGGNTRIVGDFLGIPKKLQLATVRKLRAILLSKRIIEVGGISETLLNLKINVIQKRYEINPQDTGWRIGSILEAKGSSFETLPNILKSDFDIVGFNRYEYLKVNGDLTHLSDHLGWYFLVHGLIEGRGLGRQGAIPLLLNRFIHNKLTIRSKWPVNAFVGRDSISNKSDLSLVVGAIPAADCYSHDGKFSIFHIGSKGKGQLQDEIEILDKVISKFVA
jgi:hypothetical protein